MIYRRLLDTKPEPQPCGAQLGPLPKTHPALMLAQNHHHSSNKEPFKTSRAFFPPLFLELFFWCFFLALCFLKDSFPWKPFHKEKALQMLAFAGCAFFPSPYISFKRRRNQPHPLARMGIKPGAPKPKWIRCQDDTGFELCRGAALVPRPPQPLGAAMVGFEGGWRGYSPAAFSTSISPPYQNPNQVPPAHLPTLSKDTKSRKR